MVGITGAQTLQLNLVAYPPDPCSMVQLGFQNRNGVAVGPSETVTLQSGESMSMAVNGNSLVAADQRVELHPTVAGKNGRQLLLLLCSETMMTSSSAAGAGWSCRLVACTALASGEGVRISTMSFTAEDAAWPAWWIWLPDHHADGFVCWAADHLDLPGGGALGQRAEVRPVVTVTDGACIASAEVFNKTTKATRAVYYPPVPCAFHRPRVVLPGCRSPL